MKIMGKKNRWVIVGTLSIILIFITVMTWFYPFSILSVKKSYTYQSEQVLSNGRSYNEILSDFKKSFAKDLESDSENEYPNFTIFETRRILSVFEQDLLISNDPVSIDRVTLDVMFGDVKRVREILLDLVAQADYTSEQRKYLIDTIINNLLIMEDNITALKNDPFITRSELNWRLDNLHSSFLSVFNTFIFFYDDVISG